MIDMIYKTKRRSQVSRKLEDKEMAATVETVKEKRPAIALSCKRKVVQAVLKTTGLAIYLHSKEKISKL